MATLKDGPTSPVVTASEDVADTEAQDAATALTNDYAAVGLSPTRQASIEDNEDAASLRPSRSRSPMPAAAPAASGSSDVLLYVGGGLAVIAALYFLGGRR